MIHWIQRDFFQSQHKVILKSIRYEISNKIHDNYSSTILFNHSIEIHFKEVANIRIINFFLNNLDNLRLN